MPDRPPASASPNLSDANLRKSNNNETFVAYTFTWIQLQQYFDSTIQVSLLGNLFEMATSATHAKEEAK